MPIEKPGTHILRLVVLRPWRDSEKLFHPERNMDRANKQTQNLRPPWKLATRLLHVDLSYRLSLCISSRIDFAFSNDLYGKN